MYWSIVWKFISQNELKMNKKIEYSVNNLENGEQECEAMIIFDNNYYYIHGCIPETEFKEILEYLYFY